MRRAVPALLATLGGLALLAHFHTAAGVKPPAAAGADRSATTAPVATGPPPGPDPTTTTASSTGGTRQIDGAVIPTRFGDVQVRVTVVNGQITDVQPLQLPFSHQRSQEISNQAAPLLHDEALQAQSAHIDLLSGATYTSDAYQQSLQAALAQIGK